MRKTLIPLLGKLRQSRRTFFLYRRLIDPSAVPSHRLAFFLGHIAEGVTDLMNDAFLNLSLAIDGFDRLGDSLQVIHRKDQDIPTALVLQLIEDSEPALGGFRLIDP